MVESTTIRYIQKDWTQRYRMDRKEMKVQLLNTTIIQKHLILWM